MPANASAPPELPILLFARQRDWEKWLAAHHAGAPGVWLRLAKKSAELKSLSYDEAVEGALCYGWIDGQKKSYDEASWLQKFTPRRAKSIWSKINRGKAERLIEAGRMKPSGLREVEAARADGRWDAAYDSARVIQMPDDLRAELRQRPHAQAFYESLNSANRYAILFRLHQAKTPETRAKRLSKFIEMLERGEKIYP